MADDGGNGGTGTEGGGGDDAAAKEAAEAAAKAAADAKAAEDALGDAGKAALKKERDRATAAEAKAKELQAKAEAFDKLEDEKKTEQQRLTERAEKAEREAEEAKLSALRLEVALEAGLPRSFANRLQGKTEAELKADAEALLKDFPEQGQQQHRTNPQHQQRGSGGGKGWSMNDEIRASAGRTS